MGISKEAASFLLSIVGVTNTVGRHILCSYRQAEVFILELFLCSRLEISPSGHWRAILRCPWLFPIKSCNIIEQNYCLYFKVSVLLTNNIALSLEGLLLIACPLFTTYGALVFFAVMYGLCSCKLKLVSFWFKHSCLFNVRDIAILSRCFFVLFFYVMGANRLMLFCLFCFIQLAFRCVDPFWWAKCWALTTWTMPLALSLCFMDWPASSVFHWLVCCCSHPMIWRSNLYSTWLAYWLRCAGHLYGTYGDYNGTFYFAGSVVFVAGAICYPLACIKNKENEGTKILLSI